MEAVMTAPRSIEARIDWFLDHNPNGEGMCAQHSWHSLGGDYGNPPAWGCANANAVYDKIKKSDRCFTGAPPRGALIAWKYGNNGHAAISLGDGDIATTDPSGDPGGSGVESISYPEKWGASSSARVWTDEYNNVRFDVADSGNSGSISHGKVYLSKLHYGQEDSDSVKRLQHALNLHHLDGGEELPITGNYLTETDEEVRLCQQQHDYGNDAAKKSYVGPSQAKHLFTCGCTVVDDRDDPV
jgi:hypothetical protein